MLSSTTAEPLRDNVLWSMFCVLLVVKVEITYMDYIHTSYTVHVQARTGYIRFCAKFQPEQYLSGIKALVSQSHVRKTKEGEFVFNYICIQNSCSDRFIFQDGLFLK